MAYFCTKCGSHLNDNGKCPNCDAAPEKATEPEIETQEKVNEPEIEAQGKANESATELQSPDEKNIPEIKNLPLDKTDVLSKKKQRKAAKKAEKANLSGSKKKKHILIKWIAIVLAVAIVLGAGLGVLAYYGIMDVPLISDIVNSFKNDEDEDSFSSISGKFTDIKIVDEDSAIEAAKDASKKLDLKNATDELTLISKNSVNNLNYYRLQENYNGIPVYGKTIVVVADDNGSAQGITSNAVDIKSLKDKCVDNETIRVSVETFFRKEFNDDNQELTVEEISDTQKVIYFSNSKPYLSYKLFVVSKYGIFNTFVSATTAEVLYYDNAVNYLQKEFTERGQSGEQTFIAEVDGLKNSFLYTSLDTDITVSKALKNHKYDWFFDNNSEIISWEDGQQPDQSAVDAMANITAVYNYYKTAFQRDSYDGNGIDVKVFVHIDGYEDYDKTDVKMINNAFHWKSPNGHVMAFCKNYDEHNNLTNEYSNEIDVVGHEFTHGIVSETCGLEDTENNHMPSAINEALADILGYCAEAYYYGEKIDWISSVRASYTGTKESNGQLYNYRDYRDNIDCHYTSTIVSHAAYLMNRGIEISGARLDDTEIAKLWYNTMLTLPSDCTFTELRENAEMVSNMMGFSTEKQKLVSRAFDAVGITADGEYSLNTVVSVFDKNGENYDNYTIIVDGEKNTGWSKSDYHNEIKVSSADPYKLKLDEGDYTVTVKDNISGETAHTISVKARKKAERDSLTFSTQFGKTIQGKGLNADYSSVIDQYKDAIENDYYSSYTNGYSDEKGGDFVNDELLRNARYYDEFHTYYALFDINGDGTDECVIGAGENKASIVNHDIFTYDGKAPISLFEIGWFGYRTNFNVSTDGIIRVNGSDGAYSGGKIYYKLPVKTVQVSVLDDLYYDYGYYYKKDGDVQTEITEEEFNGIVGKYESVASVNFDWIEITLDEEDDTSKRTTSDERDIVLVLDVSGSMYGTPLSETKKASVEFIDTVLEEDASIGVVAYDSYAEKYSDFSVSASHLKKTVNSLYTGGNTNTEAGLSTAYDMLKDSNAKKKIIVLMSDGMPNEGKVGDSLIEFANEIKNDNIYIYTLGFFEDLGYDKASAQNLMEGIASEGCHYEVSDADSLVFFFGDIADQIKGQKYIYIRIACPVDVSVSHNGEKLNSEEGKLNTRTSFGSLTFEETDTENEDDLVKILRLKDGEEYKVKIEGTGKGKMNYTIGFMDEDGEYSDLRKFKNIKITKKTEIDTVAANESTTVLNVDEDGDGKYDLKYKAKENGNGELVDYSYIIYICIAVAGVGALVVLFFVFKKRFKKQKVQAAVQNQSANEEPEKQNAEITDKP